MATDVSQINEDMQSMIGDKVLVIAGLELQMKALNRENAELKAKTDGCNCGKKEGKKP
jgi:hypothetical protein|tara:strand:+ start:95 stop:268 length:174 start_codon:yes stop_codon:yes gene_type:complete